MKTRTAIRVLLTTAVAASAMELAWAQCINPPTKPGHGWRPGTVVRYQFIGSWDHQSCVVTALQRWTNANASGSGVRFEPVEAGQSPTLTLSKTSLAPGVGGGATEPSRDSDGYITGIGVQFASDTNVLDSCEGFLKVALHELGHAQNLDDTSGSNGSSVMNQMSGKNDQGGNIPTDVTSCDKNMAASESPAPPVRRDDDGDGYSPDDPEGTSGWDCDDSNPNIGNSCFEECGGGCECFPDDCSPIIIPLTSGNVRLSGLETGVMFDIGARGKPDLVAWPANSDSAWLALDRNGNGTIDDGSELFGNSTRLMSGARARHGYEALLEMDANGDGVIDARDPLFSSLLLWRDHRRDGRADSDELTDLDANGIVSISLDYRESAQRDRWGNVFRYRSLVEQSNKAKKFCYDVFLRVQREQ